MVLLKVTRAFDYRETKQMTTVYRPGEWEVEDHVAQVCLAQSAGEIVRELEADDSFDEAFDAADPYRDLEDEEAA